MKLSVVIPAHNEAEGITATLTALHEELARENIDHEIVVVDDSSTDSTHSVLTGLQEKIPSLVIVSNKPPNGYGLAVRKGLEVFTGDAVAVYMADSSDTPQDLVHFFRTMEKTGTDCVFGSRFIKGGKAVDYPLPKLVLNRLANGFIKALFRLHYNDVTNAFKLYRREVILGIAPLLSPHFNLTVEMPLKAIVRGYNFQVVPNTWLNRESGISKLKIREMGSRYLFIVLYCFIEKWLSRGDYRALKHQVEGRRRGK